MNAVPKKQKKQYGPFAFAASAYALGVVAFGSWTILLQRNTQLEHIDASLANGAVAAEQILDCGFIKDAVETCAVNEAAYAVYQTKLKNLATASDFDAVGAVARRGDQVHTIIAGISDHGVMPTNTIHFQDTTSPALAALVQQLVHSGRGKVHTELQLQKNYGRHRLHASYHALSTDNGYATVVVKNIDSVNALLRTNAVSKGTASIFLLMLAVPLVVLYSRAQDRAAQQMAKLNARLQEDVEDQKEREDELKDAIRDLERFNAVTVGRENRIIELKAEVNTLLEQMNRKKRYNVDHVE